MDSIVIQTDRLRLVLQTPREVLARVEAMRPEDRAEVSPEWLERVRRSKEANPWLQFFSIVERGGGADVGSCGYKGPPDAEGMVEIAYGVDPDYRGRGYATEAAGALATYAFGREEVRLVRAHTLPGNSASTRVLTKCGFERVGEVMDPEDGLVCRWELPASPTEVAPR
jgi:RimJ/RimL family protein N-acetyltransferase